MLRPHTLAAASLLVLLTALTALPALAQERGSVSGAVTDKKTNHAIPFATVTVVGSQKGGLTDSEGKFLVTGVPVGTYEVKVQFLGYAPASQPGVVVTAGKPTPLKFVLEEIVVHEEKAIEVTAERRLVDVRQGSTVRSVTSNEIRNLPVQTITEVLQQQAGISTDADQIHVRGGRADETLFMVNGVANRDQITGQSTAGQLNAHSVAEVNVATGAYDVRFGNALSGLVEVKLKEGTDHFEGGLTTAGGTYGRRIGQLTLGGPLGHNEAGTNPLTWFTDLSFDYQDTRFPGVSRLPGHPHLRSSYEDLVYDRQVTYGSFFAPSEDNNWAGRLALSWKSSATDRWNLDLSRRIAIDQGFSRTFINAAGDVGDPSYPWIWKNRIDHAPTIFEDNLQTSLKWRRTLSTTGYTEMQFSRFFSAQRRDVQGKLWTEYEPPDDLSLPLLPCDTCTVPCDTCQSRRAPCDTCYSDNPARTDYFRDTGDDNTWQDRRSLAYRVTWGLTKRVRRNEFELGLEHQSQTAQYVTIENPWDPDPQGLGGTHDIWRVHPWIGDLYVGDRLEFEGFTANLGLRADYWFVGREAERALADIADTVSITPTTREEFFNNTHSFFGRRYKLKFSPRMSVAHPITEHSSFFFNYGEFTQIPSYRFVYSKLTSISSESFPLLGNPNLNPQVSINYEVGAKHQFESGAAVNATFFVKDLYDYPVSTLFTRTQGSNLVPVLIYLNGHYARSRGFEVEVEKRRGAGYWSGKISYTFQQTRGKSSDPNEAKIAQLGQFDAAETRLSETFVSWNRPHKVSVNFDLRFTDRAPHALVWLKQTGINFYVQGQSGRAYTPVFGPNSTQSAEPNSRNALFQMTTDMKLDHAIRFGSQRFDVSLAGQNIFGTRVINRVDGVTGRGRVWGVGQYDPAVFDVNDFVKQSQVDDPSNYGPPAQWRLALDYDF